LPIDFHPPEVRELDLAREGIGTVLFSAGFRPDYSWIDHPVVDDLGFLRQARGIAELPGLFTIGMLWQLDQGSATLFGMPRDARHVARHLGLIEHDTVEPGLGPRDEHRRV
jgi:putative flavoprotein involved in K+ transport